MAAAWVSMSRVQHGDLHIWALTDRLVHEVGSDEAGSAGDEQTHWVLLRKGWRGAPSTGGVTPISSHR